VNRGTLRNAYAGVRIEAGDDVGRERLCRYGARAATKSWFSKLVTRLDAR
jgi:hypothetical protein